MSGGFFRGTSADQDTRFSNKQAKLLKSQKFAPELENLVDMTKVKLDVMRPWIAKRVTELIGFEDEVLINFIYELLEGKGVNGKQIQISLTGFMERNTGKFMKELWALLLSAEQNVSGVPQQFLDAKEEETKRKMVETDRIANEMQRKKETEKQEIEQEKTKMGGDGARPRDQRAELELNLKDDARGSSVKPAEKNETYKKNGQRRHGRDSQSPDSSYHSPSLRERQRSRSISGASPSRSPSISPEKQYHSSPKRSMKRSPSPRRRSPHSKRHSPSHSRRRFPSPRRLRSRSPLRRRSRSPVRRRSRTPIKRSSLRYRSRTPSRQRSPSPAQRRCPSPKQGISVSPVRGRSPSPKQGISLSPVERRSPSPVRRRRSPTPVRRRRSPSPLRRRRSPTPVRRRRSPSPVRRRRFPSPVRRRRSPSPVRRRRSPSPVRRRRSPSPVRRRRSPARKQYRRSPSILGQQSVSPVHRKRSSTPVTVRSPQESSSPSDTRRSSLSPVIRGSAKCASSPVHSRGERARRHGKHSPARISPKEIIEPPAEKETSFMERRPVVSLRSPQREMLSRDNLSGKERELSPPLANASRGKSPNKREKMAHPENSNPLLKAVGDKPYRECSVTSADDEENLSSREVGEHNNRPVGKYSPTSMVHKDSFNSSEVHSTKSHKNQLPCSDLIPDRMHHQEHRQQQDLSTTSKASDLTVKGVDSYDDGARAKDKKIARAYETKSGYRLPEMGSIPELSSKSEHNGSLDSPTKDTDEYRIKRKEKRKHKKSHRQEVGSDDYSSYDSHEERKEAKKRKKEEKKIKKEERRRRRDDRHHKRDGSHAEKHSEDESVRRESRAHQTQETESEQKRLEIELREKALESLRAKKGISN